jgi:hypothetical protein
MKFKEFYIQYVETCDKNHRKKMNKKPKKLSYVADSPAD